MNTAQLQQRIRLLHAQDMTYKAISERLDVPYQRVINVISGRVKAVPTARSDKGSSRHSNMQLIIGLARDVYFQQGKMTGNISACIDIALNAAMLQHGVVVPKATAQRHVYAARKRERWDVQFAELKQQHTFQSHLPKLHHDYWNSVGFNDYWVIDGRKTDMWVFDEQTGAKFMPQGFYIMELRTGLYLHVSLSDKAFSAPEVMQMLIETALRHGVPNLGILCDNGAEQIGLDNVQAMEMFWPREIIELYRTGSGIKGFHDIYPNVKSPVVTSLPRIPTEFAKARLERSFRFIQERLDAFIAGHGYQGGGRHDVVHTTLNRSPRIDHTWISFDAFQSFMQWFLTSDNTHENLLPYSMIERPKMLRGVTLETGLVPTVRNAVDYCLQSYEPQDIPTENYFRLMYHALPKFTGKRVRKIHAVEFQSKGVLHSYVSNDIDYTLLHQLVDVVPDPQDDTRAAIFHNGECIAIARDVSRSNITIGEKKELLARVRRHAVQQVRVNSRNHPQRVLSVPVVEDAPPLRAIETEIDGATFEEISVQMLNEEIEAQADDDISTDTLDILDRIKKHRNE